MKYLVMRHGNAGGRITDDATADRARMLTADGKDEVMRASFGLKRLLDKVPQVVCSPFVRTQETAEIAANILTVGQLPVAYEWLIENAPLQPIVRNLKTMPDGTIVVTHHDIQERLTAYLIDGRQATKAISLPFSSVVLLDTELDGDIKAGVGHIEWAIQGQQLAMMSGLAPGAIPDEKFAALVATTSTLKRLE